MVEFNDFVDDSVPPCGFFVWIRHVKMLGIGGVDRSEDLFGSMNNEEWIGFLVEFAE